MMVTVLPGDGFNQGGKTIEFEVGSYPWNPEYDFAPPLFPKIYGYSDAASEESASFVKVAGLTISSLLALTLF
jgi:hypothetical protein